MGWLVRLLPSQPKTHERQQCRAFQREKALQKAKIWARQILAFCTQERTTINGSIMLTILSIVDWAKLLFSLNQLYARL